METGAPNPVSAAGAEAEALCRKKGFQLFQNLMRPVCGAHASQNKA